MTETLAHWYSSASTRQELSNEYQYDRVEMVNLCVIVLWMEVASALEGLTHQASTLTLKVTGPIGPVAPRIYWSCKILTGPTSYICIVFAFLLGCKFLLQHIIAKKLK